MEWELGKGQCGSHMGHTRRGKEHRYPTIRGSATVLCSDLWDPEAGRLEAKALFGGAEPIFHELLQHQDDVVYGLGGVEDGTRLKRGGERPQKLRAGDGSVAIETVNYAAVPHPDVPPMKWQELRLKSRETYKT